MNCSPSPVADDQRTFAPRADQDPGLVGAHGDERVVPAQLGVGGADGGEQIAVVVMGNQVGDHLGVGLGGEDRAPPRTSRALSAM